MKTEIEAIIMKLRYCNKNQECIDFFAQYGTSSNPASGSFIPDARLGWLKKVVKEQFVLILFQKTKL